MKLPGFLKLSVASEEIAEEQDKAPRGASRERLQTATAKPASLPSEAWWKPFWTGSSLLLFFALLWGLGDHLWQWLDRPVETVVIEGQAQHLDRQQLARIIAERLESTLLQVDLPEVQQLVKEHPWVRVAAVRIDWPGTLVVSIEEEVPVARWGERGLLNHQGDIFWPELKEQYRSLPRLSGPSPDTNRVMSQFHDFNQMLRPAGLHVVSLDLEARGAWSMTLDNQIKVVVGREAVNERLQRFLDLYQLRLSEQADEIEQIDIRYTHGVAVKWRVKPDHEKAG